MLIGHSIFRKIGFSNLSVWCLRNGSATKSRQRLQHYFVQTINKTFILKEHDLQISFFLQSLLMTFSSHRARNKKSIYLALIKRCYVKIKKFFYIFLFCISWCLYFLRFFSCFIFEYFFRYLDLFFRIMTSAADAYEAKDFAHAIAAAMNNQSVTSKRKELGENIFKHIPKDRLTEYFIALINYVLTNANYKILVVKSDLTLLHVIVQVGFCFFWILNNHLHFRVSLLGS